MKIKLYRSSTVGVKFKSFKILTDPWLTEGEYYGSWHHYPPYNLPKRLNEINSYNAIYISHIHPDHCSERTLLQINKNIPIYIHEYHSKFLKFKLEKLGFKIIELENGKRHQIFNEIYITIYAADNCDPKLCYKFNGCANFFLKDNKSQQIDSFSIIENKDYSILNLNDCPFELTSEILKKKLKLHKKIDLAMLGYGGAGPYPQCFDNLTLIEKKNEEIKKKKNFLMKAVNYLDIINPKYYLPFAGTYVLSGKLVNLNELRGLPTIDEAYKFIDNELRKKNLYIKAAKINVDKIFDLSEKKRNLDYKFLDNVKLNNYIKKIKKIKFDYEKDKNVSANEIYNLAKLAFVNYLKKKIDLNIYINSDIFFKIKKYFIMINSSKNVITMLELKKDEINKYSKSYVIFDLDERLFKRILLGPKFAHWNNAEIGSHIKFFRYPDIFERNLHASISYFHC